MTTLIIKHKRKIALCIGAAAYVALGIATGDMDWTTAATKFVTLVGLGAL